MSDEDYDVSRRSVKNLFSRDKKYVIPSYQRRYAWKVDNAEQLFTDLTDPDVTKMGSPSNLLGAMVIMTKTDPPEREVVDGQQRLATLSLLFCAIRTYLYKFNNVTQTGTRPVIENMIEKLDKLLEVKPGNIRVTVGEYDRELFGDIIANKNPEYEQFCKELQKKYQNGKKRIAESHSLMVNNYKILCKETYKWAQQFELDHAIEMLDVNAFIKSINQLEQHVNDMTEHNHFAYIQVTKRHVAYKIFNTFNSLGQRLQQADLIKSHLLTVTEQNQVEQEYIKNAWQIIFDERLEDPDGFLYESLSSRHPSGKVNTTPISMSNLYKIVESYVKSSESVHQFVDDLKTDAKLIKQMKYPEDMDSDQKYDKLRSDFHGIRFLNAGYIRVPILAAYRSWGDNRLQDLSTLVDCLLVFFFKFKFINDGTAEDVRSIANNVTKRIIDGEGISTILYHILIDEDVSGEPRKRIDPQKFQDYFPQKIFKLTVNVAKYILISLEIYIRKEAHMENEYPNYNFELEHILPKNHEKYWSEEEFLPLHPIDPISKYKNRLGNLTLLSSKWNKNLGARHFATKKTYDKIGYANSGFVINQKYLKDYDSWTASNLDNREKQLCNLAPCAWDLDKYDRYLKRNDSTA